MQGRTTEGFYDTASHRSQQASQHQSVYQKEKTLPKRRCPRRGKPERDNGANQFCKPNDASMTKPRPCVKPMLADAMRRQFTNHWQSACKPRLQSAQANHKECYPETAGYQQLQVGDRSHSTSKIRILALPTEEFAQVIRRNECADE